MGLSEWTGSLAYLAVFAAAARSETEVETG